jgi:hypothetical protein
MEVVAGKSMQVIFSEIERSFASILDIGQASFGLRRVPLANFNDTSDCVPKPPVPRRDAYSEYTS